MGTLRDNEELEKYFDCFGNRVVVNSLISNSLKLFLDDIEEKIYYPLPNPYGDDKFCEFNYDERRYW